MVDRSTNFFNEFVNLTLIPPELFEGSHNDEFLHVGHTLFGAVFSITNLGLVAASAPQYQDEYFLISSNGLVLPPPGVFPITDINPLLIPSIIYVSSFNNTCPSIIIRCFTVNVKSPPNILSHVVPLPELRLSLLIYSVLV